MKPSVARAYVNHGRWVVECECRNAVEAVADPAEHQIRIGAKRWRCAPWSPLADPRGFCGASYTVLWPVRERMDRIAGILNLRSRVHTRNWEPGESIAQLLADSLEHGDAVPEGETGS